MYCIIYPSLWRTSALCYWENNYPLDVYLYQCRKKKYEKSERIKEVYKSSCDMTIYVYPTSQGNINCSQGKKKHMDPKLYYLLIHSLQMTPFKR